jgi:hypothetical protein
MWGRKVSTVYFFGFAFTSFIGVSQHTGTHAGSHPHGSSMIITSPHSSHLYFVPFFAIHLHLPVSSLQKSRAALGYKTIHEARSASRKMETRRLVSKMVEDGFCSSLPFCAHFGLS